MTGLLVMGGAAGLCVYVCLHLGARLLLEGRAHRRAKVRRADARRVHQLEFELGFRDDPPDDGLKIGPGVAISYDPPFRPVVLPSGAVAHYYDA